MEISKDTTVGEVVAENYKAAAVFKRHKIDFCCNGNKSLEEAIGQTDIKLQQLLEELSREVAKREVSDIDYRSWPLDLIVDYIEKKHHRYVEKQIPNIRPILEKITAVHGDQHPELEKIKALFEESAGELTMHMKKEELMLFPYIKKMVKVQEDRTPLKEAPFGEVANPIAKMMEEHDQEGSRFSEINKLSNNYALPEDACNSYAVCFNLLKDFEEDLHLHIHLENNILFPSAEKLEKELTSP